MCNKNDLLVISETLKSECLWKNEPCFVLQSKDMSKFSAATPYSAFSFIHFCFKVETEIEERKVLPIGLV